MTSASVIEKRDLRQRVRTALQAISRQQTHTDSLAACELLRQQPVWRQAQAVLLYSTHTHEIDLSPLLVEGLKAGKTVALPRFLAETGTYDAFEIRQLPGDCAPGKFGISEPAAHCARFPLNRLDLALVPSVAFDSTGHRLGRGQGFYDRLLAQISATKCGVAFDCQLVGKIPAEAHDVRMNFILTPTRWWNIPK